MRHAAEMAAFSGDRPVEMTNFADGDWLRIRNNAVLLRTLMPQTRISGKDAWGTLKLQDWTLQDWTLTDNFAGVDIAGLDNGGPDIDGLDIAGLDIDGRVWAQLTKLKLQNSIH